MARRVRYPWIPPTSKSGWKKRAWQGNPKWMIPSTCDPTGWKLLLLKRSYVWAQRALVQQFASFVPDCFKATWQLAGIFVWYGSRSLLALLEVGSPANAKPEMGSLTQHSECRITDLAGRLSFSCSGLMAPFGVIMDHDLNVCKE